MNRHDRRAAKVARTGYADIFFVLRGPIGRTTVEEWERGLKELTEDHDGCRMCNADEPAAAVVVCGWRDTPETVRTAGICAECAQLQDAEIQKRADNVVSRPRLSKRQRQMRLTPRQQRELERRALAEEARLLAAGAPCSQDAIDMAEASQPSTSRPGTVPNIYLMQALLNVYKASTDLDQRMPLEAAFLAGLAARYQAKR
jgi:hypothetical protein